MKNLRILLLLPLSVPLPRPRPRPAHPPGTRQGRARPDLGHAPRPRARAPGHRAARPLGRSPHLRRDAGRPLLRAGVRGRPGPSLADGDLAPDGGGEARRGARAGGGRARPLRPPAPLSRGPRRRVPELRSGRQGDHRGLRARRQRLHRGEPRPAAGRVRARRLPPRAVDSRGLPHPHGRLRDDGQRLDGGAAREARRRARLAARRRGDSRRAAAPARIPAADRPRRGRREAPRPSQRRPLAAPLPGRRQASPGRQQQLGGRRLALRHRQAPARQRSAPGADPPQPALPWSISSPPAGT